MKKPLLFVFCLGFLTLANAQTPNIHLKLDGDFYDEVTQAEKQFFFKPPADNSAPFAPVFVTGSLCAPVPGGENFSSLDYSDPTLITNQYYVEIGGYDALMGQTKLTFSFWFKSTTESTGGGNGAAILGQNTAALAFMWNSQLYFRVGTENHGYYDGGDAVVNVNQNEWYHVAMVYNSESANTKLYLNGVLAATSSETTPITGGIKKLAEQGFALGNPWGQYLGLIDEVQVFYNTALDANQVKALYDGIPTGVDYSIDKSLKIYPNPTSDILYIESGTTAYSKISIRTMLGSKVREANDVNSISVKGLTKGMYLVYVENDNKRIIRKVLIK